MRFVWKKCRGLAFVEVLIVVIVLGILAAVVVPQFSSNSRDARRRELETRVHAVRSQIDSYKTHHGGQLPDLTISWTALTAPPENPLRANTSTVKNGIAIGPDESVAFVYDYGKAGDGTGRFWGVDRDANGEVCLIGD